MKESDREGITNHSDPEPCVDAREGGREALTGADAGEPLSREIQQSRLPTPLCEAEGNTPASAKVSTPKSRRGRRPSARIEASLMGTGISSSPSLSERTMERSAKAAGRDAEVDGCGKSDGFVVPRNPANEVLPLWAWAEERGEGRNPAKSNPDQQNASRTQSRTNDALSALDRVSRKAKSDQKARFTCLFHLLDVARLRAAFERLQRRATPGVDGMSWQQYEVGLETRLHKLCDRLHRGSYRAKPSRRVYIPKPDGRQRPLGVAALEDKIVQSAVVEVLNAVYERDFLGLSYGFRPGRSAHQALDTLATALCRQKVNWVLDADISAYFDTIDHAWLMKMIEYRIGDKRLLRLIAKWLKAGVVDSNRWKASKEGTPQGAVISPLLANVYLHYVLDLWVARERKRPGCGEVIMVRYADDFILGFQHKEDAERFLAHLRQRLEQFKLQLHPGKTRLIRFGRFAAEKRKRHGQGKPPTFGFLGFTHICGQSRKGGFVLMRHTIAKRQRAKLQAVKSEIRVRQHLPIPVQGAWLADVLRGYFAYHAVPTNIRSLAAFRTQVSRHWYHALRRRGQKRRINWSQMDRHIQRWLPRHKILHPWPTTRFDLRTRGKSRVR
jgi:RNA-directed DNA polymerase